MFHLYGGKVGDADMKSHAKEIIDAADKYGVVDLKLEAEASLVRATTFNMKIRWIYSSLRTRRIVLC